MAENKKVKKVAKQEPKFFKRQLIASDAYRHRVDLLNVLLEDDKKYTKAQVDKLIKDFLKGSVK